ncbi:hypothetical protein LF1_02530 [Rubripirellula obstinata]|uniref:Uncharacterized protein n=1 Tax=Rubripirellula obstinata TaxID=406547 RepID=A0A5B1CE76_9BACT|nr:hypothetical protein LF1_02530 [Rubripirellula obstinata]
MGMLEMNHRHDELYYRYADRAKEAKDRFSFRNHNVRE